MMRQKWIQIWEKIFPVSLFSVVTFAIFMPSSLFLGNIDEFMVDFYQVFPIILLAGVILFGAECGIGFLLSRSGIFFDIYGNLIFGITLGFYIQGNFLNIYLPTLNGGDFVYEKGDPSALVSVIAWVLCIVLPQAAMLTEGKKWERLSHYGSWFLSGVQLLSLVILVLTTHRAVSNKIVTTANGQFELGTDSNVIVFIVDALDAQWAEEYVLNDPEYREIVNDFVYFDNVVGGGAQTIIGLPTLFTGVSYDDPYGMSIDEYYKKAYGTSTFFKDMKENDYAVHIYTNAMYLNHADVENIDNVASDVSYEISAPGKFAKYLYQFTAYYAMPYPLKKYFIFYGGRFSGTIQTTNPPELDRYRTNDVKFYNKLCEERLSVGNIGNLFVLYHLFGAHRPFTMDENCERVKYEDSSVTYEEQLGNQIHGAFHIVAEYFAQLKELGLYDSSTIIIMADHGRLDLCQNPAVFIKKPYEKEEDIVVNSSPVMFVNVRASMAEAFMEDASAYGPTLFDDVSENAMNGRYHTAEGSLRLNNFAHERTGWEYDRYIIGSPARDTNLIQDASH